MKKKILLGINNDGEIVFGNIEINSNDRLSISFDYVLPINITYDDEYLIDRVDSIIDGGDKNWLYDLCMDYDCSPNNLANVLMDNWDAMDILDCSLYPHSIETDNGTYVFESMACGQHVPEALEVYVNKQHFDSLIYLWNGYHMAVLSHNANIILNGIIKYYQTIDEEKVLKDFINYLTN